jgi:hypothetical protein
MQRFNGLPIYWLGNVVGQLASRLSVGPFGTVTEPQLYYPAFNASQWLQWFATDPSLPLKLSKAAATQLLEAVKPHVQTPPSFPPASTPPPPIPAEKTNLLLTFQGGASTRLAASNSSTVKI